MIPSQRVSPLILTGALSLWHPHNMAIYASTSVMPPSASVPSLPNHKPMAAGVHNLTFRSIVDGNLQPLRRESHRGISPARKGLCW